jgi:hypothetical protein
MYQAVQIRYVAVINREDLGQFIRSSVLFATASRATLGRTGGHQGSLKGLV